MTDTKLLEDAISRSGFKKSFLAKEIGLSPFGLAKKIKNVHEFKTSEITGLCNLLKIDSLEDRDRIFFAQKVD